MSCHLFSVNNEAGKDFSYAGKGWTVKMDAKQFLQKLRVLTGEEFFGVISYTSSDGAPRARWMSPAFIRGVDGLFAVTSKRFGKALAIDQNPRVHWMFQDKALREVLGVSGRAVLIDNPSLKAQVIEVIGPHLSVFWGQTPDPEDLIVIETQLEQGEYYSTMTQTKYQIPLDEEKT